MVQYRRRQYAPHGPGEIPHPIQETQALSEDKQQDSVPEKVTLSGNQLVEYVKKVIAAGNVRRLIIRKADDEVLLEVPLTAGVAVGGALTALAPVLAALGAMAALLTQVKVEIVRTDRPDGDA
jgi:hypothetical protein